MKNYVRRFSRSASIFVFEQIRKEVERERERVRKLFLAIATAFASKDGKLKARWQNKV